jgi:hypothetical protein
VRRHPRGRLELPREVVGAEMGRRHDTKHQARTLRSTEGHRGLSILGAESNTSFGHWTP